MKCRPGGTGRGPASTPLAGEPAAADASDTDTPVPIWLSRLTWRLDGGVEISSLSSCTHRRCKLNIGQPIFDRLNRLLLTKRHNWSAKSTPKIAMGHFSLYLRPGTVHRMQRRSSAQRRWAKRAREKVRLWLCVFGVFVLSAAGRVDQASVVDNAAATSTQSNNDWIHSSWRLYRTVCVCAYHCAEL